MQTARPAERSWSENLGLGLGVVYVLNALLYTTPKGTLWAALETHVPMRVPDEDDPMYDSDVDDFENVAMEPIGDGQGLYFFGALHTDRTIMRLSRHHIIPINDIVRLYGETTDVELRAHFGTVGVTQERRRAHPQRRQNKMTLTSRVDRSRVEPIPVLDFGMAARQVPMATGLHITGPDADAAVAEEAEPDGLDARLSRIWYQMLFDVIKKAPNPRSAVLPSYIEMTPLEHTEIEEDVFKTFAIPFRNLRYKVVDPHYWQVTMFDRFFPAKGTVLPATLQNFNSCQYFRTFTALMGNVSQADSEAIRSALRPRWKMLYWMPVTASDRMWLTRTANTGSFTTLPANHIDAAPQVALNPFVYRHGQSQVRLRGPVDQYPE